MTNLAKYDSDKWSLYINQSNSSTTGLDEGTHTYQAYATDQGSRENQTEQRTVTIDTTQPTINLQYPPDPTTNTTDSTPDFIFNVTDNLAANLSCELFLYNETTLGYGYNTSAWNDTQTTITANTSLMSDTYIWWINCSDQAGNSNVSDNRTLVIEITPPAIVFIEPPTPPNASTTGTEPITPSTTRLPYSKPAGKTVQASSTREGT
jgi:hypothetical protein